MMFSDPLLAQTNLLVVAVLLAAAGCFIWWMTRPKFQFVIIVKNGDVQCKGGLAKARIGAVKQFFQDDVQLDETLKIYGNRLPNGQVTLQFRGLTDRGTEQRIRNYLLTVL